MRLDNDANRTAVGQFGNPKITRGLAIIHLAIKLGDRRAQILKLRHECTEPDPPIVFWEAFYDQGDSVFVSHQSHHDPSCDAGLYSTNEYRYIRRFLADSFNAIVDH